MIDNIISRYPVNTCPVCYNSGCIEAIFDYVPRIITRMDCTGGIYNSYPILLESKIVCRKCNTEFEKCDIIDDNIVPDKQYNPSYGIVYDFATSYILTKDPYIVKWLYANFGISGFEYLFDEGERNERIN